MDIQKFKELSRRALEVTDELGLHREAVSIPLEFEGEGGARLRDKKFLEIVGPEGDLDPFFETLADQVRALDLSEVPRADD